MAVNIEPKPKNPGVASVGMGIFVTIEGIDGSGKSTIVSSTTSKLREMGFSTYATKEPSNSEVGRLIRSWALKKETRMPHPSIYALLFAADRTMHYMTEVSPALAVNDVVISERYMESTIAYQGALGLSMDWLINLHKYIPRSDIVIILDLDVDEAMRRLERRGDLEVFERKAVLEKVRNIFLERARENGYEVVDASKRPEEVTLDVVSIISKALYDRGGPRRSKP